MSYPLSSPISPGDATLASQYNNLRSDAILLGQSPTDAITIGQLLERYESRLTLNKLNTAQVRVPASIDEPVSLFIDGYLVQANSNIDLDPSSIPNGSGIWYVFGNRISGSTSFTLSISTSPTENTGQRRLGSFYFNGILIVHDSIRTELSVYICNLLQYRAPIQAGGRLSLATGVPVTSVDIASASSLFYTPYINNRISLYVVGFGWRIYDFEELSLSLSTLSVNTNYDVFIHDDEGTLKLSVLGWSNDTLRASALSLQDGVLVRTNMPNYRYIGTLRTLTSGGACADCSDKRFLWNMYNRIPRRLYKVEEDETWTYSAAVWRPLNNNNYNRLEIVIGIAEDLVDLQHSGYVTNSSTGGQCVGIALDATNNNNADLRGYSETDFITIFSSFHQVVSIGYHYLQLTEWASGIGTSTFRSRISTLASSCTQWGGLGWLKA